MDRRELRNRGRDRAAEAGPHLRKAAGSGERGRSRREEDSRALRIAPGIHRIGVGLVNAYLLEEGGEVTIVDAGAPSYWDDLPRELETMGRSLADVRALLLTHAHVDHVGFAERLRRERGVAVRVHELDARLARGEVTPKNQSFAGPRPLPVLRFLAFAVTHGLLRATPILEVATFGDGATLDV
ncbi:MAG: MBL fold metallo-hydrolase, partial [Chloroflexi bacterium]